MSHSKSEIANCSQCGNPFKLYASQKKLGKKYCSPDCYWNARGRAAPRPNCLVCGNPIRAGRSKYCSGLCYHSDRTGKRLIRKQDCRKLVICKGCKKEFSTGGRGGRKHSSKFCSVRCKGISSRNSLDHLSMSHSKGGHWGEIRNAVMSRDGHECRICRKLTNLQVHHIVPRAIATDHSMGNLAAVCRKCHQATECLTVAAYRRNKHFDPQKLFALLEGKSG